MVLFVIGILALVMSRAFVWQRFETFLLLGLLLSPVPAALTSEGTPHALRSLLLSFYVFLFSCYGFSLLGSSLRVYRSQAFLSAIMLLLAYEASGFLFHYFVMYPPVSALAMDGYGLQASLVAALQGKPKNVFLYAPVDSFDYAHLAFARLHLANPDRIPIRQGQAVAMTPGSCVIYRQRDEALLPPAASPYSDFVPPSRVSLLHKFLRVPPTPVIYKARCMSPV
jgi:hypothetical protein